MASSSTEVINIEESIGAGKTAGSAPGVQGEFIVHMITYLDIYIGIMKVGAEQLNQMDVLKVHKYIYDKRMK